MEQLARIRIETFELRKALSAAGCRFFRGLDIDLVGAYRGHPAAWHAESPAAVDEALRKATSDGERETLQRLRTAVAGARVGASAVRIEEALAEAELAAIVEGPEGQLPLRAGWRAVAMESQRGRRERLADACGRTAAADEGRRADGLALRQEALAREGRTPWQLAGLDGAALAAEAKAALATTADAFGELLPWALSRWVQDGLQRLPRGDLADHDLAFLQAAPFLGGAFPGGALRLVAEQLVEAMGFDARRRSVRLDLERRPLARIGACVDGVVVSLAPLGTPADWRDLFGGVAAALHHASSPSPGDPARVQAFAAVFRGIVRQPLFYRRVLAAPRAATEDSLRAFALLELLELRTLCGQVLYERELWTRAPSRSLARTFGELLADATGARHDERLYLHGAELGLPASARLHALTLAGRIEPALVERCNEDWWRNPRTGPFLQGAWAGGDAMDAAGLEALPGPAPLDAYARQLLARL